MRILYILNSSDPGGMEQHVLDLVSQMILRKYEVFVWCRGGLIYDWYKRAGAQVYEKSINRDIDIVYIRALKHFVQENKIQIIHSHELKATTNALLAGFLAGVKVRITHQHTPFSDWQVSAAKKSIYNICYSLLIRLLGTKEIALAESIKRAKKVAGIPEKKLKIIPNGIDVYKFYVTDNEKIIFRKDICRKYHIDPLTKIIGNISRTTEEKGHDLLLKAFAKLVNEGKIDKDKYTLMICGGGGLEESLWNLADALNIKDRLVITGRFDDDIKTKFYSAFDFFIFPTLAEGFGIVLIEALISELPVLCSGLQVLKEIGRDFPDYFEPGDVEDLSNKMEKLLHAQHSGKTQKDFVEQNYSLEKFGENYSKLYENLLSI